MTLSGAIIDLDGTVYRGNELLDGTQSGIRRLRDAGLDLLFFSNNPVKDGAAYVDRLSGMGLDIADGEACSAGVVTTEYLLDHHADDDIFCIGAEGLRGQFLDADLALTADPTTADVLVASWTPEFDYGDMRDALAVDEEAVFLGTDPDRTFPMEDDSFVPGSGAIIGSVASVVGRDPDAILGKPSEQALAAALDRLDGADPAACLVVGDRLDTDLRMGDRAGMTTVLVLTGVSDRADIAGSDIDPDYVIEGLGEIGTVLDDLAGQASSGSS